MGDLILVESPWNVDLGEFEELLKSSGVFYTSKRLEDEWDSVEYTFKTMDAKLKACGILENS